MKRLILTASISLWMGASLLMNVCFDMMACEPIPGEFDPTRTSVGIIPLTDLGTGSYQSKQGGLYSGGFNVRPATHEAAGLALAQAIQPRDGNGIPDSTNGTIGVIAVGISNQTHPIIPENRGFGIFSRGKAGLI